MRVLVFTLAAVFTATIAPAAFAQNKNDDNYGYRFDDDYMLGDTLATPPPIIKGHKKSLRVQLIRARASFVAEMLKSVEAL